jgi:hypothetical protein
MASSEPSRETTISAASAAAIRKALRDKGVYADDPAFLVLQACEMSLLALEQIPKSLDAAAEKRLGEIEAQVQAAAAKVGAEHMEALKGVAKEIRAAATKAAAEATRAAYSQASRQLTEHGEVRLMAGFMAGAAATLISSALAYQIGLYVAMGGLPPATGIVGRVATMLSAPIGLAVVPLAAGAVLAGLLSLGRR